MNRVGGGTLNVMRVLVVEDEPKMAGLLHRGLREEGFVTDAATNGADAVWRAREISYRLIILDVMLPDCDGFEVCRTLRHEGIWTPVLMLTARDAVADRVIGLDSGADDYLVKPFAFDELLARARALARRTAEPRPAELSAGDLRLDPATRRVWRGDVALTLTPLEYSLLEALLRAAGRVLGRQQLVTQAWDEAYEQRSNVLDVAITSLRNKVDKPFGRRAVETVRGVGYRIRGDGG
jgi:two-component system OmpR family response regulator